MHLGFTWANKEKWAQKVRLSRDTTLCVCVTAGDAFSVFILREIPWDLFCFSEIRVKSGPKLVPPKKVG